MTTYKNIQPFDGGFTIDITNDGTGQEIVEVSQYELSRNNIRGDKVKSVKAYNYGNTSDCFLESNTDKTIFGATQGGVQPFIIGRSDLKITAFWASPNTKKFVFYYENVGNYVFDLIP